MNIEATFCQRCGNYQNTNPSADITTKTANQKVGPTQVVTETRKH